MVFGHNDKTAKFSAVTHRRTRRRTMVAVSE